MQYPELYMQYVMSARGEEYQAPTMTVWNTGTCLFSGHNLSASISHTISQVSWGHGLSKFSPFVSWISVLTFCHEFHLKCKVLWLSEKSCNIQIAWKGDCHFEAKTTSDISLHLHGFECPTIWNS